MVGYFYFGSTFDFHNKSILCTRRSIRSYKALTLFFLNSAFLVVWCIPSAFTGYFSQALVTESFLLVPFQLFSIPLSILIGNVLKKRLISENT